jgi:hypothetical protein
VRKKQKLYICIKIKIKAIKVQIYIKYLNLEHGVKADICLDKRRENKIPSKKNNNSNNSKKNKMIYNQ